MDYTQILNTDYNGLEHVAIGQTRGGNDEWITPVTLWELDTSTGLYMPPGISTNPKAPRVVINGSLIVLGSVTTDTVVTAGSSLTLVDNTIGRLDYKTVRVAVRWVVATASVVAMAFSNTTGTGYTAGITTILTLSSASYGTGEGRIDGRYYAISIQNTSASDATLRFAEVLGVK